MRRRQYWRQFSILFLVLEKMNAFHNGRHSLVYFFLLTFWLRTPTTAPTARHTIPTTTTNHNQPQLNAIAVLWRIHFLLFCCSRHIRISRCCTRLCGFSGAIMGSSTLSNDGINLLRPIFGSADDLDLVICAGKQKRPPLFPSPPLSAMGSIPSV